VRFNQVPAIALLGTLGLSAQASTLVSESFDSGLSGWTAVNGAHDLQAIATGGDQGAYISAADSSLAKAWAFQAPTGFLTALGAAYGGDIGYSLMTSRVTSGGEGTPDLKIVGNGITLVADAGASPGMSWTAYSVALTPGSWHLDSLTGSFADSAQIQSALSGASLFLIRGDYSPLTRGAVTGLDSVVVTSAVPEAQTWAMWLGGIAALGTIVRLRRR
jgi:hypothetical protein